MKDTLGGDHIGIRVMLCTQRKEAISRTSRGSVIGSIPRLARRGTLRRLRRLLYGLTTSHGVEMSIEADIESRWRFLWLTLSSSFHDRSHTLANSIHRRKPEFWLQLTNAINAGHPKRPDNRRIPCETKLHSTTPAHTCTQLFVCNSHQKLGFSSQRHAIVSLSADI
jgi:hypothetical protein